MKRTDAAVVGHDYRMHKLPLRMVHLGGFAAELAPAFRVGVGGELPKKSFVAPRVREGCSTVTARNP